MIESSEDGSWGKQVVASLFRQASTGGKPLSLKIYKIFRGT
ncbi:hypothetical protein [Liquorilactobacillus uvarum]|nr:hypothetical protein [Liquorilactobacillus uvarum]